MALLCAYPEAISRKVFIANKYKCEIVVGAFTAFSGRDDKTLFEGEYATSSGEYCILKGKEILDEQFIRIRDNISVVSACNKLYERTIFDKIRFPVGKLHEDVFVAHLLWNKANLVAIDASLSYGYRTREGSITNTSYSTRSIDCIEALLNRLDYVSNLPVEDIYIENTWMQVINEYTKCSLYGKKNKCFDNQEFQKRYYEYSFEIKRFWKSNKRRLKKNRIKTHVAFINPCFAEVINRIYLSYKRRRVDDEYIKKSSR